MDFITLYEDENAEKFADLKPKDIDTKLSIVVTKDGYIQIIPDEEIGATPEGMANAMISLAATALVQYGDDMESMNELANNITFAMAALFSSILGENGDELDESE